MSDVRPRTHILICEYCGASTCRPCGELPPPCRTTAKCRTQKPTWRIALPMEITKSDRRFLRSLRITE